MNKLTKIILSITGAGVIMAAGNEALPSAVAMDKVQKAYQSSGQLKEKYKLQDSKFVIEAKDKNKVKVELGETNSADFEPSLTFSRWEGEAKFKIKPDISKVKKNNKGIEIDGEKIKYKADKKDYVFYDISEIVSTTTDDGKTLGNYSVWGTDGVGRQATTTPATDGGGYEFEIVLNEKPASNVSTTAIESTGVEFYKQKALNEEQQEAGTTCTATECKDADGNITASRPDNVVDSIAVYSTGKQGDYTALGGMNYMAGKVAHIYRVKAVDANNDWAWCDQDITDGIWTKTCPQEFLDKAVYPVVIDPTFGYDTVGGSQSGFAVNNLRCATKYAPASDGTITDIKLYARSNGNVLCSVRGVLYKNSDNTRITYGAQIQFQSETNEWKTLDVTDTAITSGTDYNIGIWQNEPTSYGLVFFYDTVSGFNIIRDNTAYHATDAPPATYTINSTLSNYKFSIYATYTAGGGAARRIIITE